MFDQEYHEFGVFCRHAMLFAELARIGHAQFGVIAAAALGDIMKQRGNIEYPRLREVGDQLTAERVFVGVFAHGEATYIAHHHQDVLIHGIDVEQVVLHLADDAAEVRQIAAQHAGLVHLPQCVRDAAPALQYLHEQRVIDRVGAEGVVDLEARMPERAHGARRHVLELLVLRQDQKNFQHGRRRVFEYIVVCNVEKTVQFIEALVDFLRYQFLRKQLRFDVLQQNRVELRDRLGGPVITLHQIFAGAAGIGTLEAVTFGNRRLDVEHQAIFATVGIDMQPDADVLESAFLLRQLTRFGWRQQTALRQFAP